MERLRIRVSGVLVALALLVGLAGPAGATESYTVRPGDTLSHIAIRTGVSVDSLVEANGLPNADRIRVGQVLIVPSGGGNGDAAGLRAATNSYPSIPSPLAEDQHRVQLIGTFEHWANANSIPVDLLMAIAWNESGWQQNVVSNKGAVGIGQLMPATSAWIASDLIGQPNLNAELTEDNIRMSARYVGWLIRHLDSEELAIAAYYQGQGSIARGVMYTDTTAYVANVQGLRDDFRSE